MTGSTLLPPIAESESSPGTLARPSDPLACVGVEALCAAIEQAMVSLGGSSSGASCPPALAELLSAAHSEVAKLRHVAVALEGELQSLEGEVHVARVEAEASRGTVTSPSRDGGLSSDARLIRNQLEAVTAAYVVQGVALQGTRAKLRRLVASQQGPAAHADPSTAAQALTAACAQIKQLEASLVKEKKARAAGPSAPTPPRRVRSMRR